MSDMNEREERVELSKVVATFAFFATAVFVLGSPILLALAPKPANAFAREMIRNTTDVGILIVLLTIVYLGFLILLSLRRTPKDPDTGGPPSDSEDDAAGGDAMGAVATGGGDTSDGHSGSSHDNIESGVEIPSHQDYSEG